MKSPSFIVFALVCLLYTAPALQAVEPPNFVLLIVDDVSPEDLGCYGCAHAETPHIDKLAKDGLRFANAYLATSSCSPSRCAIITGRYPHNHGAPELHTTLPLDQPTFVQSLRDVGYHTVISGKNHMSDKKKAADIGFAVESPGKGPGKQEDWVELLRSRPKNRPFFFWFASSDAHRGWNWDDENLVYNPDDIEVPPYLFDGPKTRQDLADYFHEVSRMDTYVGRVRDELERQGVEDNTWIIFMADNGRAFPRSKTRLYDSGIKTPFIVYAPGRIKPEVTDSLVSSIDISATLLDLAGIEKPATVQGISFAPVLRDPAAITRNVVFAEHNWHVNSAHERMVRHGDWVYIRNSFPHLQSLAQEQDRSYPAGEELWNMEDAGKLDPASQRDIFLVPRPADELYHVGRDPNQLTNLAANPEYRDQLKSLKTLLDRWIKETGDSIPKNPTPDRVYIDGVKQPQARGERPGESQNATTVNAPGPVLVDP
ncbi:MAG: sulfatase [Verrucomicrobiota bacterium]